MLYALTILAILPALYALTSLMLLDYDLLDIERWMEGLNVGLEVGVAHIEGCLRR